MASDSAQCQIVNKTGKAIILKIIGPEPESNYTPNLEGVDTGLLFADPPADQDIADLHTGQRFVIVWNSDGSEILSQSKIVLKAPSTIEVTLTSATVQYANKATIKATDQDGNNIAY